MRSVSFYALSRVLQDRLTGSISEGFSPAPLARIVGGPKKETGWLALTGGSLVALLVLYLVGYGSLGSSLSQHGPVGAALYVAFVGAAVFSFVASRRHLSDVKAFPLPRGVYLFPACVIDATSADLRVYPTVEGTVSGSGPTVGLAFGGKTFSFTSTDGSPLAELVAQGQRDTQAATAANDSAKLTELDPLHEPRFSSPVGPRAPYAYQVAPWQKLGWAVALGVGVVFGTSVFFMRNATSEALLYSRAKAADTEDAYRAYLQHGKTHAREVSRTLLPRAVLKVARTKDTVEAIVAFQAAFPDTDIAPEVDDALHQALLAELERAKTKGKLGSLQDFEKAYPKHGLSKEVAEAIHAVYDKELARVVANVPPARKAEMEPVLAQLFASLEKGGPTVELRYRRRIGPKMAAADKAIMKTITYNGAVSLITHYFDPAHEKAREEALGKTIGDKLGAAFDPELVRVVPSGAEPDGGRADEPFPKVTVPTLFLVHGADWSGHTYTSRRPRVTVVGLNFAFDAVLVLPADKRTFKTKHEVFKGVTMEQIREPGDTPLEERIYAHLSDAAYAGFEKKVVSAFVKE